MKLALVIILLIALVCSGCATVPVAQDGGPAQQESVDTLDPGLIVVVILLGLLVGVAASDG